MKKMVYTNRSGTFPSDDEEKYYLCFAAKRADVGVNRCASRYFRFRVLGDESNLTERGFLQAIWVAPRRNPSHKYGAFFIFKKNFKEKRMGILC